MHNKTDEMPDNVEYSNALINSFKNTMHWILIHAANLDGIA